MKKIQCLPIVVTDLLEEMKVAQVDMCLIWQNPALTRYTNDQEHNYEILLKANRDIFEIMYQDKFLPSGWTDPKFGYLMTSSKSRLYYSELSQGSCHCGLDPNPKVVVIADMIRNPLLMVPSP